MDEKKNPNEVPAEEPSAPVVRTYAQDLAAASGKPMPPEPKKNKVPIISRPITIPPTVPPSLEPEKTPMPVIVAPVPPLPSEPAPLPEPVIPQENTAPAAPVSESPFSREAVLERLRAIQAHTPGNQNNPLTPSAPAEETPSPAPIASDRIHTYKSDFAEHIGDTKGSAFSVLAAEQDAGAVEKARPAPSAKSSVQAILLGVLAVVLVLGGAGGVYFAYVKFKTPETVAVAVSAPSLIFVDEREELSGTGSVLLQALSDSANKPLAEGAVRLTYIDEAVATPTGTTTEPAPGGVLIQALALPAPDILFRNTDPSSTVGIVHAGDETAPFFILRVTSYERTFAGMLSWESTMPRDLALLYPPYPVAIAPVATSTATSSVPVGTGTATGTSPTSTPATPPTPAAFRDEVLGNYNVRVLKDASGKTVLMYGYKDESTLIIARNEDAFTELANRLSATKTQ